MITTPVSLLVRLSRRDEQPPEQQVWERDWARFVELFTPLLCSWARRLAGLPPEDAADLVQDVFVILVRKLPEFRYDRDGGFRKWLCVVLMNKFREQFRQPPRPVLVNADGPSPIEPSAPDDIEEFDETEYRQFLARRALELMQTEFQRTTWQACWEVVVEERDPAEVARELGMSVDSVYQARHRVLRRLRQELAGLLD